MGSQKILRDLIGSREILSDPKRSDEMGYKGISLQSKHLKGQFGPRVGDGNAFAPKEVIWDPVLVT